MKYESICNIKHMHKGHWFDESTMRFFKSKVYETVYCGEKNWYFVSSERFSDEVKRLFTVREFERIFNARLLKMRDNYLRSHIARKGFKQAIENVYKLSKFGDKL
jgi:hypothetical protein